MKRRDFLGGSAAAALLVALPTGLVRATRRPLLEDPLAWLGSEFRLRDGTALRLSNVEQLACDRHSTQLRLQFRTVAGTPPREGTYALHGGGREQAVFLQDGSVGPVACVNRLHASA